MPSRRLDRAWKLAPAEKRDVDATLWYLEKMVLEEGGGFRLAFPDNRDTGESEYA